MMATYLEKNPPRRRQFRQRYGKVTGCIVVHTAENVLDSLADGVDSSAEKVAAFIRTRTDPGSYHNLADSDSRIRLVPYWAAAYGDGTGSNEFALHLSFACRTTDWATMSKERRRGFLIQGAKSAAAMIRWVEKNHGIKVPSKRISRAESEDGKPGFTTHAERDPSRRSDPGANFPWDEFFELLDKELGRNQPASVVPLRQQLITARKAAGAAARAARNARDELEKAVAEAEAVGRKPLAQVTQSRADFFENQRKSAIQRRDWIQGRVVALKGLK